MDDEGTDRDAWVRGLASVAVVGAFIALAYYGWGHRETELWSYGTTFFVATPILQGAGAGVFS